MSFVNSVFWIKNRLRGDVLKQYREICHHERLSASVLRELEWERQKAIVEFAYEHSAFYKSLYDHFGFHPSMLKDKNDWQLVPIVEKEEVRKNRDSIVCDNAIPSMMAEATTGGSTGIPLKVFRDKRFHHEILGWRSLRWWGVSPGDSIGILHRRVPTTFIAQLRNRVLWWPTYRAYLDASSINEKRLATFIDQIVHNKVKYLQGYVGALERVADYIIEHEILVTSLRLVWSTSAPLHDIVRKKMELAFNCKVMNQYGCNEIFYIATQCPLCNHLHVHSDCAHIDVINDEGNLITDKDGNILVTDLLNKVFPLIKYRLGDRGRLLSTPCSCGLPMPLMAEVQGRVSNTIVTPSGIHVDGVYLSSLFDGLYDIVSQFQIRQFKDYRVVIFVCLQDRNSVYHACLENVRNALVKKTKGEISIEIEVVDRIADDRGKIRYIISDIRK